MVTLSKYRTMSRSIFNEGGIKILQSKSESQIIQILKFKNGRKISRFNQAK